MPADYMPSPEEERADAPTDRACPAVQASSQAGPVGKAATRHRRRLTGTVAVTATKLLPLLALLDTIQPSLAHESVFRTRRKKIQAHLARIYEELRTEQPRQQALVQTFQALAELVREETRDISKDELKQGAKEFVLATLQHAPALINAAHQARLLS